MKRNLCVAAALGVGVGLAALSMSQFVGGSHGSEEASYKPSRYRSRSANLSPADRLMQKAQGRRKKGGAA